jgi:type II secretory pathway pseudopilin PulG
MKRFCGTQTNAGAFTLLEVLIASMLIGLAIVALAASSGAFTLYNAAGVDISTAEFLIEEIRELTAPVAFSGLSVYGVSHTPPVDAAGTAMPDFSAYTQQVTVAYVNPANLTQTVVGPTDFYRVTVAIIKNGMTITSTSWIRAKY